MVAIRNIGFRLAILASALMLIGVVTPVSAAETEQNIGIKPANPQKDNPRSTSIFVYKLKPGAAIRDEVQVINNTDEPKTIDIYAVDSATSSGGAYACAQKADTAVGVGTWVSLDKNQVTVGARDKTNVGFTLTVPKDATPGEQNGCFALQETDQEPVAQGNGVTISFRSALRIAVTVPGKITKGLVFSGIDIKDSGDTLIATVALRNNGNVSLDTTLEPKLANILDNGPKQESAIYPILPNSTGTFNLTVQKPFWGGFYSFSTQATYNSDTSKTLGESGDKDTLTSKTKTVFIAPQPTALLIEIGVLVALLGLVGFVFRKQLLGRLHANKIVEYTVRKNDTLQKLADRFSTNWKTIAHLNGIKPPYHLESGQVLKIPVKNKQPDQDPLSNKPPKK